LTIKLFFVQLVIDVDYAELKVEFLLLSVFCNSLVGVAGLLIGTSLNPALMMLPCFKCTRLIICQ